MVLADRELKLTIEGLDFIRILLSLRYPPKKLLHEYQALKDFPCVLEHLQCFQMLRQLG